MEEIGSIERAREEGTDDMGEDGQDREYWGGSFTGVVTEMSESLEGRTRATTLTLDGILKGRGGTWSLGFLGWVGNI